MQHSPTLRRFRRVISSYLRRSTGAVTAAEVLASVGLDRGMVQAYAGQVTKAAAKLGTLPAVRFWTRPQRFRRTRVTAGFTDWFGIVRALFAYAPVRPRVLKNGQPSKAKTEAAKATKRTAYLRAVFGQYAGVIA